MKITKSLQTLVRNAAGDLTLVDCDVTVDFQAIVDRLAEKARRNKSMVAKEVSGAVVVEFICDVQAKGAA